MLVVAFTEASRSEFLAAMERKVTKQVFDTWIKPLDINCDLEESILQISAPSPVARRWIVSNYSDAIQGALAEMNLNGVRVEWGVSQQTRPTKLPTPDESFAEGADGSAGEIESLSPEAKRSAAAPMSHQPRCSIPGSSSLNQKYVFSSFVVASCNRLPHAAAEAVAENPGRSYNPFYLYGGVGLGKTHLVQAIGHLICQNSPALRVAYLSLEQFMNELVNAIRYGYDKTQAFRARYRTIDVLLIDDIQFIAGKERTQEEFFHTFNALYDGQKQIVITSDCPPREIREIEERLHSRFEWGLIAEIEPPDLETKVAILKRKAELQKIDLPDDVALFLAVNSKRNIRELEGSLVRLLAMASLRGVPLSKTLAEDSIGCGSREESDSQISIARIQRMVADHYGITVDYLKVRSNTKQVLEPRQLAMYLCKTLTQKSYPEIGRHFGGKHHTTVMHSVEKIHRQMASDAQFAGVVRNLREAAAGSSN